MLVVLWLALIVYTYLDARRRIEDPFLIACATVASFFPFIGTVVYAILRPPEFLEDRHERELEISAAELRLRQLIEQSCPHCEYPIENNYLRCPNCERRLKALPHVQQAARPELGGLPLLRDRGRGGSGAAAAPSAARAASAARRAPGASAREARARRAAKRPAAAQKSARRAAKPAQASSASAAERAGRSAPGGGRSPAHELGAPAVSRTLILVKPDAFERALTGEVIARFERKGLSLVALKLMQADEEIANEHYAEHTEKPFFGELVEFITGGPLVAMVLEGTEAVQAARQVIGATDPVEAAPARSAATSRSRSPSTSSTAPTPTSRPSARSGSGSPSWRECSVAR